MGSEFDVDALMPDGPVRDAVKKMIADVDHRIDTSSIDYRFTMQVIGEKSDLPSADVLTLIVAQRYAQALKDWDGEDMFLPFLFARLTIREMSK